MGNGGSDSKIDGITTCRVVVTSDVRQHTSSDGCNRRQSAIKRQLTGKKETEAFETRADEEPGIQSRERLVTSTNNGCD